MENKENRLFWGGFDVDFLARKYGTPLYVYDAKTIRERYRNIVDNIKYPYLKVHYAVKANSNPAILRLLKKEGANAETVSQGSVSLALKAGFKPNQIIYTCNGVEEKELKFLAENHIRVNIDSLSQLEKWGQITPNSKVGLRLNLDLHAGSHAHLRTGGKKSKFGIHFSKIKEAKKIAARYKLQIVGLHQHIGTDTLTPKPYIQAMKALTKVAHQFGNLEYLDFGSGLSIPYKPGQEPLDIKEFGKEFDKTIDAFVHDYGKEVEAIIEPGRYLVAESGTLIAKVTDIKENGNVTFIAVNTGMGHLVRPAMYGAYHKIINASRIKGKKMKATIVGNICESGDTFGTERDIVAPKEGDLIAILDAGAYGFTMSSFYNARVRPAEILIDAGKARVIRKRQEIKDALPYF